VLGGNPDVLTDAALRKRGLDPVEDEEAYQQAWEQEITKNLPGTLKLHGVYPSTDTRSGTCLWEANSVHEVQQFLDKKTGQLAKNFCYEVNVKESMGLPTVKLANALAN
jgi:hypothetical protein